MSILDKNSVRTMDDVGYKKDSKKLVIVGLPVVITCVYVMVFNVAITQWVAYNFAYHSSLGKAVYKEYYLPWSWFGWTQKYSAAYPDFFNKVWAVFGFCLVGLCLLLMFFIIRTRKRSEGNFSLHGTAHFATQKEIEKSGLYKQDDGVYVGAWQKSRWSKKEYLRHNSNEHVSVFAPTRSGKGVGLILPTLLSYMDSVFVFDIKGENFALTAGWRKKHANNFIIKFEPNCNDGSASCFNPFEEVRMNTDFEFGDCENIIDIVAAPDDANAKVDAHFDPLAKSYLTAVAIHLMHEYAENGQFLTLPELNTEISADTDKLLENMVSKEHTDASVNIAKQMIDRRENSAREAGGIISTAQKYLRLYNDPIVAKNVSKSDFKITDLMRAKKPVSFYLIIPSDNIVRFAPLTRLITVLIVRRLAAEMEFSEGKMKANYRHKLLLMLDEFPAFGPIPILESSLGFLAGYGIKAYIIAQDRIQLEKAYTREQTITTNCHIMVAYPPNEKATAQYLSDMAGQTTVVKKKTTTSGKRASFFSGNMSTTTDEIKRPLLTTDEISRMGAPVKDAHGNILVSGEMLIFQTGKPPIRGTQILFFQDPCFLARSKVSPPTRMDLIR